METFRFIPLFALLASAYAISLEIRITRSLMHIFKDFYPLENCCQGRRKEQLFKAHNFKQACVWYFLPIPCARYCCGELRRWRMPCLEPQLLSQLILLIFLFYPLLFLLFSIPLYNPLPKVWKPYWEDKRLTVPITNRLGEPWAQIFPYLV